MKSAIYKVGYKLENPQRITMTIKPKSSLVHHPAIPDHARSVISISDSSSDIEESMTEPDTELEHYLPENQLGLPENRAWLDYPHVSCVSEASGKHLFDCRQMEAEDSNSCQASQPGP
jgi:hypothetical protein